MTRECAIEFSGKKMTRRIVYAILLHSCVLAFLIYYFFRTVVSRRLYHHEHANDILFLLLLCYNILSFLFFTFLHCFFFPTTMLNFYFSCIWTLTRHCLIQTMSVHGEPSRFSTFTLLSKNMT